MGAKKRMLVLWVVASLGWVALCAVKLDLKYIGASYERLDYFATKVARGRADDPMRWDYNLRSYQRAQALVGEANRNLGLFILLAFGFPGIMLSVGTFAMRNIDVHAARANAKNS